LAGLNHKGLKASMKLIGPEPKRQNILELYFVKLMFAVRRCIVSFIDSYKTRGFRAIFKINDYQDKEGALRCCKDLLHGRSFAN
jgi:hypothetical protein